MSESWVYFIEHGTLIKIGTSTNMARRLRVIPGHLLALQPGDRSVEAALHRRFANYRVYGEWFTADKELTDFVEALPRLPEVENLPPTDRRHGGGYKGKMRAPDADDALDQVVTVRDEKRLMRAEMDAQIADAIGVALSRNVSLRQIAHRLGVSPETVRKMGGAK